MAVSPAGTEASTGGVSFGLIVEYPVSWIKWGCLVGLVSASALSWQSGPAGGDIQGRVLNSVTSAPVRKVIVSLRTPQGESVDETDAEGRFQFTALPAGSYNLSARHSGFQNRDVRRPVVLGLDEHVTGVDIRLLPLGSLAGRVLDEDGDPVGEARVTIFRQVFVDGRKQWDAVNPSTQTNDLGEYRCPHLAPGRYLVEAFDMQPTVRNTYGSSSSQDRPEMVYAPAYYPSAPNEPTASPVSLGAGADVSGIDIRLVKSPLFHVRGKISGASQHPQTPVTVSLKPADGTAGWWGSGQATAYAPDYTFDVRAGAGQYTLWAIQGGSDAPEGYATDSLTVSADVSGLVIALGAPATTGVSGRISIAENGGHASLQGVRVSPTLLRGGFSVPDARFDATGKFVFPKPMPPGHYALEVDSLPAGCYVKSMKVGGQEVSAYDVEILFSAEIEIVLSTQAGTITGSVLNNDGKPSSGSRTALIPSDSDSRLATQLADDNGKFKFTAVRPGTYKLFAWEEVDENAWQDPEFRRKYESHAAEITIGASETRNVQLVSIPAEEMN